MPKPAARADFQVEFCRRDLLRFVGTPQWATDTTGLTWSDCAQFGATSHAIAVDFPHCCGRNNVGEEPGHVDARDSGLARQRPVSLPTVLLSGRGLGPVGQHPTRARKVAGIAVWVVLQIVLVLGLCLPERPCRRDLGDDLARP
jgi:hypothetical protein